MAIPRPEPYIWPSWITKLITGDRLCWWAPWYQAHFSGYREDNGGFDLSDYKIKHTALLTSLTKQYKDRGLRVTVENENKLTLRGQKTPAVLGGKPDLIVWEDPAKITIVDAKTGKQNSGDVIQVKIYMLVLPLVKPSYKNVPIYGRVAYLDHQDVFINPAEINKDFITEFAKAMAIVGGETPPATAPSLHECRYCKLIDCADRRTTEPNEEQVTSTDLF